MIASAIDSNALESALGSRCRHQDRSTPPAPFAIHRFARRISRRGAGIRRLPDRAGQSQAQVRGFLRGSHPPLLRRRIDPPRPPPPRPGRERRPWRQPLPRRLDRPSLREMRRSRRRPAHLRRHRDQEPRGAVEHPHRRVRSIRRWPTGAGSLQEDGGRAGQGDVRSSASGLCRSARSPRRTDRSRCFPSAAPSIWRRGSSNRCRRGTWCRGTRSLQQMPSPGIAPNGVTFSGVVSSCSSKNEIDSIHAAVAASDCHENVVVKNSLVAAYARVGHIGLAREVFDSIKEKDLISWNSMVVVYTQQGHGEEVLDLFGKMDVEPDSITFASILGACSAMELLGLGTEVHARVAKSRFRSDPSLVSAVINMYCKCNALETARRVFDELDAETRMDPSPWNAMMSGLVLHGRSREALGLFDQMKSESVRIDKVSFATVLGACSTPEDLAEGIRIHELASACGIDNEVVVENAIFNMYSKCRRVDLARKMFDRMQKTVISWNVMIAAYSQADYEDLNRQGLDLYSQMEADGVQADDRTYIHLLSACVNLGAADEALAIHRRISTSGFKPSEVLETAIVTMYARFGMLDSSRSCFDRMEKKSVTAWNAMISAYSQQGQAINAIVLFNRMNLEGIKPDARTFVSAIGACSSIQALDRGRAIEEQASAMGIEEGRTALLSLFAKSGDVDSARVIFDELKNRKNVVSWNSMIAAYAQSGRGREALDLYEMMKEEGVDPDDITYAGALGACPSYGGSIRGAEIHARIVETKISTDVFLDTAIVNMYAKCGDLEAAMIQFEKMRRKNSVTWSAMVGALIQHGYDRDALDLYFRMISEGYQPSEVTLGAALAACSRIGALQEGRSIHSRIQATESLKNCLFLQNSLLNMYAKCGCLAIAGKMFSNLQRKDSFSWNTIIVGHAHHGDVDEVLGLHGEMVQDGIDPDYVTFACVLLACSHAGLLDVGRSHFWSMEMEFGVIRDVEHYLCMVDLLSRAGRVESAEELVHSMPFEPPAMGYTTLLSSSEVDLDRGSRYAEVAAGMEPDRSSSYVLLWNIYSRSKADASGLEHLFL